MTWVHTVFIIIQSVSHRSYAIYITEFIYRVSNMSSQVLLNITNKVRKRDKNPRVAEHFMAFFATIIINSIIQELNY